jgi:hypothetical protein
MGDMDHSSPRHQFARWYGPAVGVFALLMVFAVWAGSWISAPFALAFVGAAYLWSLGVSPDAPAEQDCTGCVAGCVGCRERIDSPITGLR